MLQTIQTIAEHLRLHGRLAWNETGALGLSWSMTGCSFCYHGGNLTVQCAPYTGEGTTYLAVTVDGICYKMPVSAQDTELVVTLATGDHTVSVRRSSAMTGAKTVWLQGVGIQDGTFLPPPAEKPLRLEFIGDSITCGYGILGAPGAPYRQQEEDATCNYAALTAAALDAEPRYLAISGQGIVHSCSGVTSGQIPTFFHQRIKDCFDDEWHFDDGWQPDAVIINAGTNDVGGKTTQEQMREGAIAFLQDVRAQYPQAKIVWMYGLMNGGMAPAIRQAVETVQKTDAAVWFLPIDSIGIHPGETGANGHPGVRGHRRAAAALIAFLRETAQVY